MSAMTERFNELKIMAARESGYIVLPHYRGDYNFIEPLFAGSLPDALEFMRKTLSDAEAAKASPDGLK